MVVSSSLKRKVNVRQTPAIIKSSTWEKIKNNTDRLIYVCLLLKKNSSYGEIADTLGYTPRTVYESIKGLEANGIIRVTTKNSIDILE